MMYLEALIFSFPLPPCHCCRGLSNVSAHPGCAADLLAVVDSLGAPLTAAVDHVLQEHALRIFHNLAVFDKRHTSTWGARQRLFQAMWMSDVPFLSSCAFSNM